MAALWGVFYFKEIRVLIASVRMGEGAWSAAVANPRSDSAPSAAELPTSPLRLKSTFTGVAQSYAPLLGNRGDVHWWGSVRFVENNTPLKITGDDDCENDLRFLQQF